MGTWFVSSTHDASNAATAFPLDFVRTTRAWHRLFHRCLNSLLLQKQTRRQTMCEYVVDDAMHPIDSVAWPQQVFPAS